MINIILAGASLGLAQLSKYSMLILYPIFIVLYIIPIIKDKKVFNRTIAFNLLLIFLTSIFIIWAGYGFKAEPILVNAMRAGEKLEFASSLAQKIFSSNQGATIPALESFLMRFPMPLGEHILGLFGVLRHSYEGHRTYLLGNWSLKANPIYFLIAFALKTPVPVILLLVLGLIRSFRKRFSINEYFVIIPLLVYFLVALRSNLQIGIRHLIPIYPLCFMISARSIEFFKYKLYKVIIIASCTWLVLGTLIIWPNFLSYFNEIAGGPDQGWRYLRDSNIDWGQDLPSLSKYLKGNGINEVTLKYFGEDSPKEYGINAISFAESEYVEPKDKLYAISVQYLDSVKWTKDYIPGAKAGYSIFIYDFRGKVEAGGLK